VRGLDALKERPILGARWPPDLQIGADRLPTSTGNGSRSARRPLPTITSSPVDVIEPEAGGLPGPQPKPDQKRQDREVAKLVGRRAITRAKQQPDLVCLQRSRQPGQPP